MTPTNTPTPEPNDVGDCIDAATFTVEAATLCSQDHATLMNHQIETLITAAQTASALDAEKDTLIKENTDLAFEVFTLKAENERLRTQIGEYQTRLGLQAERMGEFMEENGRLRLSEAGHALDYKFMQDENAELKARLEWYLNVEAPAQSPTRQAALEALDNLKNREFKYGAIAGVYDDLATIRRALKSSGECETMTVEEFAKVLQDSWKETDECWQQSEWVKQKYPNGLRIIPSPSNHAQRGRGR